MGFFIRKSVRLGPIRFNLSKSGVGTSIGVKGFRVGEDARGRDYVQGGRGGIYFRENLGKSSGQRMPASCIVLIAMLIGAIAVFAALFLIHAMK